MAANQYPHVFADIVGARYPNRDQQARWQEALELVNAAGPSDAPPDRAGDPATAAVALPPARRRDAQQFDVGPAGDARAREANHRERPDVANPGRRRRGDR